MWYILDLKKAFDTVSHSILPDKLSYYGVRGVVLKWFESCLRDRKQSVSVNGISLDLLNMMCGVPQGSILGPLIFLSFINDLPTVSKKLKFYLFAVDTNIHFDSDKLEKSKKKLI